MALSVHQATASDASAQTAETTGTLVVVNKRASTATIVDVESGELLPFTIDVPRTADVDGQGLGRARWIGDGQVAFTGTDGAMHGVYVQDFARSGDTSATLRKLAGFDPEWQTESFDVSPDGKLVILSRFKPRGTVMVADGVPFVKPRAAR